MYYNRIMKSAVQARLDPDTAKALARLIRELGWSPSKIVREALRLLAAMQPGRARPKIVGMGKFSSGVADLGSNKKHLQGFGG
jgi:hypothetical protein